MNTKQFERMRKDPGFIAALDQSGGSTPKALKAYGIEETAFHNDEEMFDLIHQMRSRIITSCAFTAQHILGAILFERTMNSKVEGMDTADYLWEKKGIVPFLKVDKGLADEADDVQLMKPMPDLEALLKTANEKHIFGTKMRSVIKEANPIGIKKIVDQQFEIGLQIVKAGLVPILEPEVSINSSTKKAAEALLLKEIQEHLVKLDDDVLLMFKLTIPTETNLYAPIIDDPHVVRVVALSGGYTRKEADDLLMKNQGLIASFSRALLSDLSAQQTQEEFDNALKQAILEIYKASVH
ncbi:fructose bisphosphate aldolase [Clostridiaceae bacterium DONG20-135]|uniref:fructose-bisphosphate aldolase n=1 Tax=Copranaerobaculum intestinale TaxID=2692629 RepID=A0A6N8U697_9FIRM|nr:fructose bisphosphate aldolase [Copranaerobaculum intestinale]MXQ73421.1 fructose bisphosphate aldolase [Copranaerobaculum intestinale]